MLQGETLTHNEVIRTTDNIKTKYEEMLNHAEIIRITDNMKTK